MKKVYVYDSYEDDFVKSANQNYLLPDGFEYVRKGKAYRILSDVVYYFALSLVKISNFLFWHVRIINCAGKLPEKGFMVYANHTQPFRDVFMPSLAFGRSRMYVLAGQANYGIPVIGKLLPVLGALPVADGREGTRKLEDAVHVRLSQGCGVAVYPEAHVWPYYTGIRPFPAASFQFAVRENVPAYCMTTTYRKRRFSILNSKKPRTVIWLDGPFYPDESLLKEPDRKKRRDLCKKVYACMEERSRFCSCEYIHYEKRSD